MHIEINAGGLGGSFAVAGLQSNLTGFISDSSSVIASFKTVSKKTSGLNGGVGNLQNAVALIETRVKKEEQKKDAALRVQQQTNEFLDLAVRVDKAVAVSVNQNRSNFYKTFPHLKPHPIVDGVKKWFDNAWKWLCDKGQKVAIGAKILWDWTKDTAKKIWNGAVEFYQKHSKLFDTIISVLGAALAIGLVVTLGAPILVPLLGLFGVSSSIASVIATCISIVTVIKVVPATIGRLFEIWCNPEVVALWNKICKTGAAVINIAVSTVSVVFGVASIFVTGGLSIPAAVLVSAYGINSMWSSGSDIYNLWFGDEDKVGNVNILKGSAQWLGGTIAEALGAKRETGELIGKAAYSIGGIASAVYSAKGIHAIKVHGMPSTTTAGSEIKDKLIGKSPRVAIDRFLQSKMFDKGTSGSKMITTGVEGLKQIPTAIKGYWDIFLHTDLRSLKMDVAFLNMQIPELNDCISFLKEAEKAYGTVKSAIGYGVDLVTSIL